MVWVKLDDQFPDHPKVAQAGPLAQLLYVNALAYANRYLTDGFIPHGVVARLVVWDFEGAPSNYELAERLVAARLWERADGGYRIHDYLDYNPSRAKVLEERAKTRERVAKLRSAKSKCTGEVRAYNKGTTDEARELCGGSTLSPDPVPVPQRDIKLSPSETATQSVPAAKGPSIEEVNGQRLIAELVAEYRTIDGVEPKNGDYPFIGSLYNQYGYEQVLCGINALRQAMAVDPIQKPLVYLKGILKREVEGGGIPVRRPSRDTAKAKTPSKYDVLLKRLHSGDDPGSNGSRGPPP